MAGYDNVDRKQLTKGMSLGFLGLRATPTFSDTFFQSYGEKVPLRMPFITTSSAQYLWSITRTILAVESII